MSRNKKHHHRHRAPKDSKTLRTRPGGTKPTPGTTPTPSQLAYIRTLRARLGRPTDTLPGTRAAASAEITQLLLAIQAMRPSGPATPAQQHANRRTSQP